MKNKTFYIAVAMSFIASINIFSQTSDDFLMELTSGKWRPKSPANIVPMNDGERFAFISEDSKKIMINEYKNDKITTLFDVEKIANCPIKEVEGFEFDKAETKILIHTTEKPIYRRSFITNYYIYDIKRNKMEALSENGEQQMAEFSPNGRIVAFARDNNLFLKKIDFDTESQITKDGKKNEIINGTPDWVYEEEFANIKYFEFSPDNRLLAYVKFNEKDVKTFSFQWINDTYPTSMDFKYPKAGTENSVVSVWVYDIENRTTVKMNLEGDDFYIPTIKWSISSDSLTVVRLTRNQKEIDILSLNPRSGIATKLYSEKSPTYTDYRNFDVISFNSDNSFVIMSEKDGFRHIYLHSNNGLEKEQLTKGDFDVTAFYGYDQKSKTVYFQAARNNPTQREIYKATNGKITPLDSRKGYQTAKFSKGFRYAIETFSDTETPTIYAILNNLGKVVRTIEHNNDLAEKYKKAQLPQKSFFSFKTSEGIELNGWILEPKNLSKKENIPVVITQYSGPDSQEAINRWDIDWEYYLAMNNYVVVCVDTRGTAAKGNKFRTCTYGQLGVLEAKDIISTVDYIKQNRYSNSSFAIWGWSYGGFMTLECLTEENNPFKAGIAIAPVTDWRLYNTAYTERFMNRPQENPQGYKTTSILEKAGKIKGSLLLIHGTADDNVHCQNSYLLAERLVEEGIEFDMQIYTNKNHSILGKKARYNLFKRCLNFFDKNLK